MEMHIVSEGNMESYIQIGITSYHQHYLHLWENRNPAPYIDSSFTTPVLEKDIQDPNLGHFIVVESGKEAGIIKIVKNAPVLTYSGKQAMLLEKIYLLASSSGKGLGKRCLKYLIEYARRLNKEIIWLDTMKTGRALSFYQNFGFEIIGEKELLYPGVLDDQKGMFLLRYEL